MGMGATPEFSEFQVDFHLLAPSYDPQLPQPLWQKGEGAGEQAGEPNTGNDMLSSESEFSHIIGQSKSHREKQGSKREGQDELIFFFPGGE